MSNDYKHIAFLCGHFKREKAINTELLEKAGWQRIEFTDDDQRKGKRYYYPEFMEFCHAQSVNAGCVRYTRKVDSKVSMTVDVRGSSRTYSFLVKELTFYFMPHYMVLYSLKVEQDASCFDDCSALIYTLRYIDGFGT